MNLENNNIYNNYIFNDLLQEKNINNEQLLKLINHFLIWFHSKIIVNPIIDKYILSIILENPKFYDKNFYTINIHNNILSKNITYEFQRIIIQNFKENLLILLPKSKIISEYLQKYNLNFKNINKNDEKINIKLFEIIQILCSYNFSSIQPTILFKKIEDELKEIENEYKNVESSYIKNNIIENYQIQIEELINNYENLKNKKIEEILFNINY